VPSGPPPTEAPTGSSAPTLSYKPTSSGQGAETEPPTKKPTMNTTKKPTANPTTTKRTPSPTKSNNVGGGGPPPPVPLVSSRPRPLLNLVRECIHRRDDSCHSYTLFLYSDPETKHTIHILFPFFYL
ncbi:hypothetical protein ACHAXS_002035, partial [Conticribra weissflogii]